MKFMGTTQDMPQKVIIIRKKLSWKFLNGLSRTGAIIWNQISSNWRDASKPIFKKIICRFLFETLSDGDDYVEVHTLTQGLTYFPLV